MQLLQIRAQVDPLRSSSSTYTSARSLLHTRVLVLACFLASSLHRDKRVLFGELSGLFLAWPRLVRRREILSTDLVLEDCP